MTSNTGRDAAKNVLDVTEGPLELGDLAGIRRVGSDMVEQARLQVLLFSQELDPLVYDHPPFLQALQRLALQHAPRARIRILLLDNQRMIKHGHRLLELARRLTSTLELRRPIAEYRERQDEFLLVDQSAYLHREQGAAAQAVASYRDPLKARNLQGAFHEIWEHSEPDPEIRRLYL
jgi:hypothetical protein